MENEDSASKYGNAFFGPSLWEKNEIYPSEKMGVKFEYLEVDDFLNENGLNEADVAFLDQLHKYDGVESSKSDVGPLSASLQQHQTAQNSATSSPFAPSPSSSISSMSASGNYSLKNLLDNVSKTSENLPTSAPPAIIAGPEPSKQSSKRNE